MRTKPVSSTASSPQSLEQPGKPSLQETPPIPGGCAQFSRADDLEKIFRLQGFTRGQIVFVRVPYPRSSDDFVLAERNLSIVARDYGVGLLLFDETTDWNALVVDDRRLFELGLMRAPK